MGNYQFETSTEIDAPIEVVWEHVTTHDGWRRPFVQDVVKVSEGPVGVGTRYDDHVSVGPWTMVLTNEITTCDAPRRLAWHQVDDGPIGTLAGSYTLELLGPDRTRFILKVEGRTSGAMAPMSLLLPFLSKRGVGPWLFRQLRAGVASMRTES